jgi:hypothetical protein
VTERSLNANFRLAYIMPNTFNSTIPTIGTPASHRMIGFMIIIHLYSTATGLDKYQRRYCLVVPADRNCGLAPGDRQHTEIHQ